MENNIKIGKTTWPISFGIGALILFEQRTKRSAIKTFASGDMSFEDMTELLRAGLETGARRDGNVRAFSIEAVVDMIDGDERGGMAVLSEAVELFSDSLAAPDQKKAKAAMMKATATAKN